jgi:hypothetical protein
MTAFNGTVAADDLTDLNGIVAMAYMANILPAGNQPNEK